MKNKQEHVQNIGLISFPVSSTLHKNSLRGTRVENTHLRALPALWHTEESLQAPDFCQKWKQNQWHSSEWEDEV